MIHEGSLLQSAPYEFRIWWNWYPFLRMAEYCNLWTEFRTETLSSFWQLNGFNLSLILLKNRYEAFHGAITNHDDTFIRAAFLLQRRFALPPGITLLLVLVSLFDAWERSSSRCFPLDLEASFDFSFSDSWEFQRGNFLREALLPLSAYSARVTRCMENSGVLANLYADWYASVMGLLCKEIVRLTCFRFSGYTYSSHSYITTSNSWGARACSSVILSRSQAKIRTFILSRMYLHPVSETREFGITSYQTNVGPKHPLQIVRHKWYR